MNVCGQGGKTSRVDLSLHCKMSGSGANEKSGKKEFVPNGWLSFKGGNGARGEGDKGRLSQRECIPKGLIIREERESTQTQGKEGS